MLDLKATGVDLAKLGAGLSAFIAGGDVNIAAAAGENAAENNAWWWLVQGAYVLWKAYDAAQTVEGVYDAGVELNRINNDDSLTESQKQFQRDELIKGIGYAILGDIVIGKTASEVLGKLKKAIDDTSIGKEIGKQLDQFIESANDNTQFSLAGGGRADYNSINNNSTTGLSNEKLVIKGNDTGLKKTTIPKDQYTEEELKLLKFKEATETNPFAPHTIERHGSHVTDEHLIVRAKTGVTPDGQPSPFIPGMSSKFTDKDVLIESTHKVKPGSQVFNEAFDNLSQKQIASGRFSITISMDKSVGKGFQTNYDGNVGKSINLKDGIPTKGSGNIREPIEYPDPLTHVNVSYNLDPETNTWYINTLYPSLGGN